MNIFISQFLDFFFYLPLTHKRLFNSFILLTTGRMAECQKIYIEFTKITISEEGFEKISKRIHKNSATLRKPKIPRILASFFLSFIFHFFFSSVRSSRSRCGQSLFHLLSFFCSSVNNFLLTFSRRLSTCSVLFFLISFDGTMEIEWMSEQREKPH